MLKYSSGNVDWVAVAPMQPIGYHMTREDLAAAQLMEPPTGSNPRYLMMQTVTQNVRYTLTAAGAESTPSATNGFVLVANADPIIITLGSGIQVRVIEVAATAVLNYQYFR